ncbi:hypothetical protein SEA27A368_00330 [Salmonella enterica]|nr:hypothetical protein SEA27A368_00330 [Salmonella enterica]
MRCKSGLRLRRDRHKHRHRHRHRHRQGRENTCKTMHLMDAWLIWLKIAGFTGIF